MNRFLVILIIAGICLAGTLSLGCHHNQNEEIVYSINLLSPLPDSPPLQVGDVMEIKGEYFVDGQPAPLVTALAVSVFHWSNINDEEDDGDDDEGTVVLSSRFFGHTTVLAQGKFSVACLIDNWPSGTYSVQIVDNQANFLYESEKFQIAE